MMIYEILPHLRRGKIARCKHSYFAIDQYGYLVRINKKDYSIIGIAKVDGDIFATDDWEPLDRFPKLREKKYGFHSSEI